MLEELQSHFSTSIHSVKVYTNSSHLKRARSVFSHTCDGCEDLCAVSSLDRSSRSEMFSKIGVIKYFADFTGKCRYRSLFFKKVTCLVSSLKKRLQNRCFLVSFVNFLEHFLYRTSSGDCFCLPQKITFEDKHILLRQKQ